MNKGYLLICICNQCKAQPSAACGTSITLLFAAMPHELNRRLNEDTA